MADSYGATFTYDPAIVGTIASRCTESASGARNISHILSRSLLPQMSSYILGRLADGEHTGAIHVGLGAEGMFAFSGG